jgi:hypothetical protein
MSPQDEFPLRTTRESRIFYATTQTTPRAVAPKPASPVHNVPLRETHVPQDSFTTSNPASRVVHGSKTEKLAN